MESIEFRKVEGSENYMFFCHDRGYDLYIKQPGEVKSQYRTRKTRLTASSELPGPNARVWTEVCDEWGQWQDMP